MIDLNEYLKEPDKCPYCNSDNVTASETDFSYINAWREVVCKDCKREWQENFTITSITEYDEEGMPLELITKEPVTCFTFYPTITYEEVSNWLNSKEFESVIEDWYEES